jgi:hypothetical protein
LVPLSDPSSSGRQKELKRGMASFIAVKDFSGQRGDVDCDGFLLLSFFHLLFNFRS